MRSALGLIMLCSSLSGCSREDSAAGTGLATWTVGPEPVVSIGGNNPKEEQTLFNVSTAFVLGDGRIAVANIGTDEVRFFSESGEFLTSAGGSGDGPGEFRQMLEMARLPGDSLLVYSYSPGLTWIDPDGHFVRSFSFPRRTGMGPCRLAEPLPLPDGRLLLVQEDAMGRPPPCRRELDGIYRATSLVTLHDPRTGDTDRLGVFPSTDRFEPFYLPHGRLLLAAPSHRRIFVGDTGGDNILVFDLEGARVSALETPFPYSRIRKGRMERKVEEWRWRGETRRGELPYPDAYPRYGRILTDREGLLWVMAYPQTTTAVSAVDLSIARGTAYREPSPEWRVLDPIQGTVARVTMPRPLFPLEIGEDYVLALVRDELGVETLLLYELDRSERPR